MPHNVNNWTKTTDSFMIAILFVLFEVVVLCPDFNTSSFGNIVYDVITAIENDKYKKRQPVCTNKRNIDTLVLHTNFSNMSAEKE